MPLSNMLGKEIAATLDREAWRKALGRIPDMVPGKLEAEGGAEALGGWTPKLMAHDPATGRKFLVKPADSLALEGETALMKIRRELGFPAPTVGPAKAVLPDGKVFNGYAKAMIPAKGALPADPKLWTPAQRNAVLFDDPWLFMVGNHDSHVRQYVSVGHTAVNVDWDRSFDASIGELPLDRLRQGHWYAPTAQGLLYQAYVKGELDLNFKALLKVVDRVQALPDQDYLKAMDPFLTKAFAGGKAYGTYATRADMEQALLARKASMGPAFRRLVEDLQAERREGWYRHPVRAAQGVLQGVMEAVNGSPAYKAFSKLVQRFT